MLKNECYDSAEKLGDGEAYGRAIHLDIKALDRTTFISNVHLDQVITMQLTSDVSETEVTRSDLGIKSIYISRS